MRIRLAVLITLYTAPFSGTLAQTSSGDVNAFIALRATHIGALTPLMTPAMISRRLNTAQLAIRYGLLNEDGVRTHAVVGSGIFTAGLKSSVTLTAGVRDADCVGCEPALMLGVGGDMRVLDAGDIIDGASALSVAVAGDLAYAQVKPGDASAIALGIGAPITLNLAGRGTTGMRLAPYFTPVFGIGQTSTPCTLLFPNCERNGIRWVLGGGLGAWHPGTNISASLGVSQVVLSGAKPVFGVNVIIGGR